MLHVGVIFKREQRNGDQTRNQKVLKMVPGLAILGDKRIRVVYFYPERNLAHRNCQKFFKGKHYDIKQGGEKEALLTRVLIAKNSYTCIVINIHVSCESIIHR